jgi:hypothetical protein
MDSWHELEQRMIGNVRKLTKTGLPRTIVQIQFREKKRQIPLHVAWMERAMP